MKLSVLLIDCFSPWPSLSYFFPRVPKHSVGHITGTALAERMNAEDKEGTWGGSWPWPPELWAEAGTLLRRPHYLLGHLEAHVGAELQHLTHLLRGGRDQGDLLYGGRLLQFLEPLHKFIISWVLQTWGIQTKKAWNISTILPNPILYRELPKSAET